MKRLLVCSNINNNDNNNPDSNKAPKHGRGGKRERLFIVHLKISDGRAKSGRERERVRESERERRCAVGGGMRVISWTA